MKMKIKGAAVDWKDLRLFSGFVKIKLPKEGIVKSEK